MTRWSPQATICYVSTTPSEIDLLACARTANFTGGYSAGALRARRRCHGHATACPYTGQRASPPKCPVRRKTIRLIREIRCFLIRMSRARRRNSHPTIRCFNKIVAAGELVANCGRCLYSVFGGEFFLIICLFFQKL